MATLSSAEARRARASKHADRSWTCSCGKTVLGNGGKASHRKACRVWQVTYADILRGLVADYSGKPGWSDMAERRAEELAEVEALLERWAEGQPRPKVLP